MKRTIPLLVALTAAGCAARQPPRPAHDIDLRRYVPTYTVLGYHLTPNVDGLWVRVRVDGANRLRRFEPSLLERPEQLDPRAAHDVYPGVDISKRLVGIPRHDPVEDRWIARGDTARDENWSLFEVERARGSRLRRLTRGTRVGSFFPYAGRVAYLARAGAREPYGSCLVLLNVTSLQNQTLLCTDSTEPIGDVAWQPDGKAFTVERDTSTILFTIAGDSALATPVAAKASSDEPRVDAWWRDVLKAQPAGTRVAGRHGDYVLLARDTITTPTQFSLLTRIDGGDSMTFTIHPLPMGPRPPQPCNIEAITYTTFDGHELHGFLRTPRVPPANPDQRLAIIYAFYGGSDEYDALPSLWCEAGIASLSPAVRGTTGDDDFDELLNGDRGGDEVVDAIYGARWLRDRLGLRERQIGVYGMSQGGYNAMRLLTFQPETNNRNVGFDFGFGIAEAGYSSMLTILQNTNTESPQIIATGDPETEAGRARLRERSPLDQVHRLNAPLLLIHGTNDERVEIEESRQMLAAARAAGKDVTLLEFAGEGHGIVGEANLLRYYRAQLDFLAQIAARALSLQR